MCTKDGRNNLRSFDSAPVRQLLWFRAKTQLNLCDREKIFAICFYYLWLFAFIGDYGREQSEQREALRVLWTNRVMQPQWGKSHQAHQETCEHFWHTANFLEPFSNIAKKCCHFANRTFWNILERAIAVGLWDLLHNKVVIFKCISFFCGYYCSILLLPLLTSLEIYELKFATPWKMGPLHQFRSEGGACAAGQLVFFNLAVSVCVCACGHWGFSGTSSGIQAPIRPW